MSQPSDAISSEKAKEILRDKEVHGHPLSEAQKGLFGAAAGRADHAVNHQYMGDLHRHMNRHYPHAYRMHEGYARMFRHSAG